MGDPSELAGRRHGAKVDVGGVRDAGGGRVGRDALERTIVDEERRRRHQPKAAAHRVLGVIRKPRARHGDGGAARRGADGRRERDDGVRHVKLEASASGHAHRLVLLAVEREVDHHRPHRRGDRRALDERRVDVRRDDREVLVVGSRQKGAAVVGPQPKIGGVIAVHRHERAAVLGAGDGEEARRDHGAVEAVQHAVVGKLLAVQRNLDRDAAARVRVAVAVRIVDAGDARRHDDAPKAGALVKAPPLDNLAAVRARRRRQAADVTVGAEGRVHLGGAKAAAQVGAGHVEAIGPKVDAGDRHEGVALDGPRSRREGDDGGVGVVPKRDRRAERLAAPHARIVEEGKLLAVER